MAVKLEPKMNVSLEKLVPAAAKSEKAAREDALQQSCAKMQEEYKDSYGELICKGLDNTKLTDPAMLMGVVGCALGSPAVGLGWIAADIAMNQQPAVNKAFSALLAASDLALRGDRATPTVGLEELNGLRAAFEKGSDVEKMVCGRLAEHVLDHPHLTEEAAVAMKAMVSQAKELAKHENLCPMAGFAKDVADTLHGVAKWKYTPNDKFKAEQNVKAAFLRLPLDVQTELRNVTVKNMNVPAQVFDTLVGL